MKDKVFYKNLWQIAIPIALQSIISTSLNIVDSFMVGALNGEALSAVGIANQYYYIFILMVFGLCSGIAVFTAQYYGKRDSHSIREMFKLTLINGGFISLLFAIIAWFWPQGIVFIFTHDQAVSHLALDYFKIIAWSYVITSISFAYTTTYKNMGNTKIGLYAGTISLIVNTLLNYFLIFGNLGFPKLGVAGAAWATLIARTIEMLILIYYTERHEPLLTLRARDFSLKALKVSFELSKTVYKVALPVIFNESIWALGISVYLIIYSKVGVIAIGIINICGAIQNLFMVATKAVANASGVMIGNKLGEGNLSEAQAYANRFMRLGVWVSGISAGILLICAPNIVSFYNIQVAAKLETVATLRVYSLFLIVKTVNIIMMTGIFRSGGMTKFALYLDAGTVWLIGIPLGFLLVNHFDMPLHQLVFWISLEELVKCIIGYGKTRHQKWIHHLV